MADNDMRLPDYKQDNTGSMSLPGQNRPDKKKGIIDPISQMQGGEGGGDVNTGDASGQANLSNKYTLSDAASEAKSIISNGVQKDATALGQGISGTIKQIGTNMVGDSTTEGKGILPVIGQGAIDAANTAGTALGEGAARFNQMIATNLPSPEQAGRILFGPSHPSTPPIPPTPAKEMVGPNQPNSDKQGFVGPNQPNSDKQGFVGPNQPTPAQESANRAASAGISTSGMTPIPPSVQTIGNSYRIQSPNGGTAEITPGQRNDNISNPSSGLTDGGRKIGYQSTPETRQALGNFINRDSSAEAVAQRDKDVADVAARRKPVDPLADARENYQNAVKNKLGGGSVMAAKDIFDQASHLAGVKYGADSTRSTAESGGADKALGRQLEGAKIMDARENEANKRGDDTTKFLNGPDGQMLNQSSRFAMLGNSLGKTPMTIHHVKGVFSGDQELADATDQNGGSLAKTREWLTKRAVPALYQDSIMKSMPYLK